MLRNIWSHLYTTTKTLSESVAVALELKFGDSARETMDCFFDCFNVSSFTKGKESRKCFLSPYYKDNDFRMEVCVGTLNF